MKDYYEMLNSFDGIQDMSVPEEMLGAYLEGNLSDGERAIVEDSIVADPYLADIESEIAFDDRLDSDVLFSDEAMPDIDLIDLPFVEGGVLIDIDPTLAEPMPHCCDAEYADDIVMADEVYPFVDDGADMGDIDDAQIYDDDVYAS